MKYGIYLPNYGAYGDARLLAELAHEAEEAGWDGFFLWDHIAGEPGTGPMVDPWIALTAVALATQSIRIGTTVTPVPRRRPWKLAREVATLDQLSGGRLILGVGIGLAKWEWDNLGEETDQRVRGAMLDEALDLITGLWRGEAFEFSGEHYSVSVPEFLPTPVQQPRVPIWVGGFWPNKTPMRRAARWDGMFPLIGAEEDEQTDEATALREAVGFVHEQRTAHGDFDGPFDVVYVGHTPSPDAIGQVQQMVDAGATWWLEILYPWVYGWDGQGDWPVEAMRRRLQAGPPVV